MYGPNSRAQSWVIRLILINAIIFFIQIITRQYAIQYQVNFQGELLTRNTDVMTFYLGLIPASVFQKGYLWQIISYMFLHGNFSHILLNMYALLLFGIPIEYAWGSKRFLQYYFFTGAGAGLTILAINFFSPGPGYFIPTIGASGAVFGVLLAFGMLYPDVEILIFFFLPMKAKYLVTLYGLVELFFLLTMGSQSPVSHAGHIGGLFFGLLYFVIARRRGIEFKVKRFRAASSRPEIRRNEESRTDIKESVLLLKNILRKLQKIGPDSLTEDDYQQIKITDILHGDGICMETETSTDPEILAKSKNPETCLLREIKKYL